ncbi:MAG: aspartate-semialdehyde dehydrogenase, partial [candidate division WOR-3 bacterium]
MLEVLEERLWKENPEIIPLASEKSAGKTLHFLNKTIKVLPLEYEIPEVDYALFSAGSEISKKFAPLFVESGAVVIDNSSAFRLDERVPLVVPEVNPEDIKNHKGIISNPNCS